MSENTTPNTVKNNDIIGMAVKNYQNENLGKIEEMILDENNGSVIYLVLSSGGVLGIGDKLFALPWKALKRDEIRQCFILNKTKDELQGAPSFDKTNPLNLQDNKLQNLIFQFYGIKNELLNTADKAVRHIGDSLNKVPSQIEDAAEKFTDEAKDLSHYYGKKTEKCIQDSPWCAVSIAAGIGTLIGSLLATVICKTR